MNTSGIDFNKDYYNILGVSKEASSDDIKKAFRKLSVQWHPDKHTSDSDADRQKAEEKFKEINEAYSILHDDKLRKAYDAGPQAVDDDILRRAQEQFWKHMAGWDGTDDFQDDSIGEDVVISLKVTYDEICNGLKDKKIKYFYNRRCATCHGAGGDDIQECPYCHGTGRLVTNTQRMGMMWQDIRTCPHCQGKGKRIIKVCKTCNGTGFERAEAEFPLTVPTDHLVQNGMQLYVGNFGSESKQENGTRGRLIFYVQHDLPNNMKIIPDRMNMSFSVAEAVELPYYDMLLGTKRDVKTPSGKTIRISIPAGTNDGGICRAKGQGFNINGNKGDYILLSKMKPFGHLSSKEKNLLEKIKDLNSNK